MTILTHNAKATYLISAGTYERLIDIMDDYELVEIVSDPKSGEANRSVRY